MADNVEFSITKVETTKLWLAIGDQSIETTIAPEDRDRVAKDLHAVAVELETRHVIKVEWAENALREALIHLLGYRDGARELRRIDQSLLVAIDALRAVAEQDY